MIPFIPMLTRTLRRSKNKSALIAGLAILIFSALGVFFKIGTGNIGVLGESVGDLYFVSEVVDGDTIIVYKNGAEKSVRLIGVDTPETVHPRKEVECFGIEATNKAKQLVEGKYVDLVPDSTQYDKDRYGRLLRYVILQDGTNVNEVLLKEGFAYEYTYQTKYLYQEDFKAAQKYAQDNELGLWGDICKTTQ